MFRLFVPILNLLIVGILKIIIQADIALQIEVPDTVVAGSEFEVKITVNKGNIESFSRFQQELPYGLTAESYLSSNADFSFDENRIRLIWLKLPRQEEFTVIYKVKVDERLKGDFNLKGKFSYIDDNERKSVAVASSNIIIQPSPYIDPELIVDIDDFGDLVAPPAISTSGGEEIACFRQKPYLDKDGNAFIINVLVNKGSKEKFAKIEEFVPDGYSAIDITRTDAIFTYKNKTAKFLWMNLPMSSYYTVSYKLIPANGDVSEIPALKGKFSFLEEDKTVSVDIRQTQEDLSKVTPQLIAQLLERPAEIGTADVQPDLLASNKVKTNEIKATTGPGVTPPYAGPNELKSNIPYLLKPESGIYYRVQVAAGHKPVEIKKYFRKYNLELEVRKEYHDGWHKYSVGSFGVYKEARDYRVHIWNTTPIDDAFVSAYNTGTRITVQEALMIANQKWYK